MVNKKLHAKGRTEISTEELNDALSDVSKVTVTKIKNDNSNIPVSPINPVKKRYRTRNMYLNNWVSIVNATSDENIMKSNVSGALSPEEIKQAIETAKENRFKKIQFSVKEPVVKYETGEKLTDNLENENDNSGNVTLPMAVAPSVEPDTTKKVSKRKKVVPPAEVQQVVEEVNKREKIMAKAVKDNVKPEMNLLAQKLVDTAVDYVFNLQHTPADQNEVLQKIVGAVEDELLKKYIYIPERVISIKINDIEVNRTSEIVHEKFEDICKYTLSDIPTFLVGNAGTGKNYLCKQIADTLKLDFYFTNAVTNEYKITGFIDANGVYHRSQFHDAFTKGGLFFFDEVDASIPETLVLLNAAIENRYFNFPTGKVDAHPNFRVIAAGNTYGGGADLQFVGRFQLDAASLDRFSFIEIDYDEKIENFIANGDTDLVDIIRLFRGIIRALGIRKIVSYRAIAQIGKIVRTTDIDHKNAFFYSLIKDMRPDDLNAILAKYPQAAMKTNKYIGDLKEALQMAVAIKSTH